MALKLCGMGKKSIIILCAWNTQLISTQRATYQILHCNRWSMESLNLQLNSVMFSYREKSDWDVYRFLGNRVRRFSVGPEYQLGPDFV